MKRNLLLLSLSISAFGLYAGAQVQADKPLQMTGTIDADRRISGVGTAIDASDAVNASAVQNNRLNFAIATNNGNTYALNLPVAPTAYTAGMILSFKTSAASQGNDNLKVNGLTALPIYKNVNEPLVANDLAANQVVSVIYDGTAFQVISQLRTASSFSGTLSGEVTGTQSATMIANGVITAGKIADGAVTDAKINTVSYSKITGAPTMLPPTGAANGDLTGTYPNPTIASGAVTTNKLADAAITTGKIVDGAITDAKINTVSYSKITGAPTMLPPTGAATGDLSGTYPNPTVATGAITTTKIADGSVTDDKINSVSYTKITGAPTMLPPTGAANGDLTGTYPNPTIAAGVVSTDKLADGAITTGKIVDGAITDAKINTVSYSKITGAPAMLPPTGAANGDLTGTYPNPTIATDAVTTTKIADAAVTDAKINTVSYSKITGAPTMLPPTGAANGDLTGTYPNPTIATNAVTTTKIADGAVTDAKINTVSYSKITGAPTMLPPTGAAGGDLSGTYPNPTVADAAITASKVADGSLSNNHINAAANIAYSKLNLNNSIITSDITNAAVNTTKLADASVTTAKLATAAVTPDKLSTTGALNGQVLVYDGTTVNWAVPMAIPTGAAGGDLSGTYPNPAIATGAVNATKLADGAVSNNHVSATANIAYTKLNLANSIVGPDIKADAISTPKLANGAVTTNKISTVGASSGQVLTYNGSTVTWGTVAATPTGTAGGDLSGTYPNPTVGNGTITSSKIADGAITNADVNAAAGIEYSKLNLVNSIVTSDLTNGAVTTANIQDAAITTAKIMDGAVTNSKIADGIAYSKLIGVPTSMMPSGAAGGDLSGAYPNPVIRTDAITTVKIADDAVTTNKIMDAAVTTTKIADASVTVGKLNGTGATNGQVLTYDGTNVTWSSPASAGGASLQFNGTITTATSFASGVAVNYDDVATNNGGQMNTSTGVFTAVSAGLYQVNASLPVADATTRFLALRVNGVDVFTGTAATAVAAPSPYNTTITTASLSVTYPLAAGDQAEVIVYNNSGNASPLTSGAARLLITKMN